MDRPKFKPGDVVRLKDTPTSLQDNTMISRVWTSAVKNNAVGIPLVVEGRAKSNGLFVYYHLSYLDGKPVCAPDLPHRWAFNQDYLEPDVFLQAVRDSKK